MTSPRWRKVWADLLGNKTRTALVVLSIAVGIFAVGAVTQTFGTVSGEMARIWPLINPPSATFSISPFDDDLVQTVRRIKGVGEVEGRAVTSVKVRIQGAEWKDLTLYAIPDFNNIRIQKVLFVREFKAAPEFGAERGEWPPPDRGVILERSSLLLPGLAPANLKLGDTLEIETLDKRRRDLRAAGLAHSPGDIPATFRSQAYGYVNLETYEWIAGTRLMDQLMFTVAEEPLNKAHIVRVAEEVRKKLEGGGYSVFAPQIAEPGRHWAQDLFNGVGLLLNFLGFMSLFLSAFLVVNTISGLLAQQTRQIGMMKAVGARRGQIFTMYLALVLAFGLLALAVAVPLTAAASNWAAGYLAGFVNVEFPPFQLRGDVLLVMILIALALPLLAGALPVWNGVRVTVREAVSDYGLSQEGKKPGWFDRLLENLRLVSRPMRLSLRNTFRRRGRLALTLLTLILGGTIFMSVFSVREGMLLTLEEALEYWKFDILMTFTRAYRADLVEQEVSQVPGVAALESWGLDNVRRVREDETESEVWTLFAPPPQTQMLKPTVVQGRFLTPEDENALVVSLDVLRTEPTMKVGDEITLKIQGNKSKWRLVGVVRTVGQFGAGVGPAYVNYPYYAHVTNSVGRVATVQVTTDRHDSAYQARVRQAMEDQLKAAGIRTGFSLTGGQIREQNELFFNIIVGLLMVMAVLMAVVGGLGLMGTMSLNVLERTREIGVMRAIGASDGAIRGIVMTEGMLIGLLSWAVGAALAYPLGQGLSIAVGTAIFQMPLTYTVSTSGIVIWLVVVLILSSLASYLPARRASKLTVREVLAYE